MKDVIKGGANAHSSAHRYITVLKKIWGAAIKDEIIQ